MISAVWWYLRRAWAFLARRARALLADVAGILRGNHDRSLPPRRLMVLVGSETADNFRHQGNELKQHFVEAGGLEPQHDVLDVGCGAGRIAIPLTEYLSGRYEGFDVIRSCIRWCQRNVTPEHPNFRFQLADIRSRHYNRRGRWEASEYRFPYVADSFDFVLQTSVLTHLLPDAASNYVRETARVLRPGGVCFATYLLLDDSRRQLGSEDRLPFPFRVQREDYWALTALDPEAVVAYPIDDVLELFAGAGMDAVVHRGTWAGGDGGLSGHDVVVARVRGS